jgi:hypothetical protein
MASEFTLNAAQYLFPTPGGAYYAVADNSDDAARRLLLALLLEPSTPLVSPASLMDWTGVADEGDALEVLYRAQQLGWVQGENQSRRLPGTTLETDSPALLAEISSDGCAMLSDEQGFYISSQGFAHEAAEELALLAAELTQAVGRRVGVLQRNLGISGGAWAAVDAAGNSQLGVWPLHIGRIKFCLTVLGTPRLNRPAFTELVWMMVNRYGTVTA